MQGRHKRYEVEIVVVKTRRCGHTRTYSGQGEARHGAVSKKDKRNQELGLLDYILNIGFGKRLLFAADFEPNSFRVPRSGVVVSFVLDPRCGLLLQITNSWLYDVLVER